MTDSDQTDPIVGALRELSQSLRAISQAYQQQALAVSVIAREGALAAETAEQAVNAAQQAVTIASEVRDISKNIDKRLEDFFAQALVDFGSLSRRVHALEDAREAGANGHG